MTLTAELLDPRTGAVVGALVADGDVVTAQDYGEVLLKSIRNEDDLRQRLGTGNQDYVISETTQPEEFSIQFGREIQDPRTGRLLGSRRGASYSSPEIEALRDNHMAVALAQADQLLSGVRAEYPELELPDSDAVVHELSNMHREEAEGPVVVHAPETAAAAIMKGGFKTQRQTGTSGGFFNPDTRDASEARMFGEGNHPVYGAVDRNVPGRVEGSGSAGYGQIQFVLNDEVRSRSTMSFGDSLDSGYAIPGRDDPVGSRDSHDYSGLAPAPMRGATDREILGAVPQARGGVHNYAYTAAAIVRLVNPPDPVAFRESMFRVLPAPVQRRLQSISDFDGSPPHYTEVQIHGPLSPKDIVGFRQGTWKTMDGTSRPGAARALVAGGVKKLGTVKQVNRSSQPGVGPTTRTKRTDIPPGENPAQRFAREKSEHLEMQEAMRQLSP